MSLYLGFDCGTQSLNAGVLQVEGSERRVLLEESLSFDHELPGYGTVAGVLRDDEDRRVVTAPPLMWAHALDEMMARLATRLGPDIRSVVALSGAAQQHGSVYLRPESEDTLRELDPGRALRHQIRGIYAVDRSPVWMDTSTSDQCDAITDALGGDEAVTRLTGSRAFERFTGPQIRKLYETAPQVYARTDRIHLVSSYLATLLGGEHAPIDAGDGSGMTLLDLQSGVWSPVALEATAPGLQGRLPIVAPSATVVGRLAPFWTQRHGFPSAKLVAWTGDNLSSLVGVGVVEPGITAISLGTSDTLFTLMETVPEDSPVTAHVFRSPVGGYMGLVCFRNGSLARQRVRDRFGLDWEGFAHALRSTPPGNRGGLMLPWFEPEITPFVATGGVRCAELAPEDSAANVRAVVEGQMLAMERHSLWAVPEVKQIHATGGGARNVELLQVMADVFGAPVHTIGVGNTVSLGAALRALHADLASEGRPIPWSEVVAGVVGPDPSVTVRPRPWAQEAYGELRHAHAAMEAAALVARGGADGHG
jgi:xylulokinase